MSEPRQRIPNAESASWLRTFYEISHSDTRWAKEQGWRVVNWTLLLFGGLLALKQHINFQSSLIVFSIIDIGIWLVAVFYLRDLHRMAKNTAEISANIEAKIPKIASVMKGPKQNHLSYFVVQLVVISTGLALVVLAHCFWQP